ncbi:amino acid adenylation domain-containing protein [Kitasatospora sp. NPDC050463]|uniref:amino acid adenylation domain-containing protein n=1 Tax=Kitasatospora sp. NPDC050463 TaxID=3155786 RepID=UPI0033CF1ADE
MTPRPSLHDLIASSARRAPDAIAVSDHQDTTDYRRLDEHAGRLAHFLAEAGIASGGVVGVRLSPGAAFAQTVAGVWRAGAAVLPLPADRPLGDLPTQVELVLTRDEHAPERHGTARVVDLTALAQDLAARPADHCGRPAEPTDAAWLGHDPATGRTLVLDQATVLHQIDWLVEEFGLEPGDRVLCAGGTDTWFAPLFAALAAGATAVPVPDPAGLAAVAAEQRATLLVGAPDLLAAADLRPGTAPRLVLAAGAELPADAARALTAAGADELCAVHLLDGVLAVTAHTVAPDRTGPNTLLGRPIDKIPLLVLDEYGDLVPPGVPGRLNAAGLGAGAGYLDDPRTTAERLRPAVYGAAGSRMHATGDLVRWQNDGVLELLGEADLPQAAPVATASGRPAYVTPETPAEQTVARIWSELLEVPQVGLEDNFFQLGGYSLLMTELAKRLHQASGTPIVLADLFGAVTVRAQAALLAATEPETAGITPVPRDRPLPLSYGQRRIWLLDTMEPSPEWTAPLFLRLPGDIEADTVRLVLDTLADRHEALRTRYTVVDGEPRQEIGETLPIELKCAEGSREQIVELFREQFETGFDLTSGRLWRATLARTPADGDGQLLLVTIHHIACDGWSAAILEEEFHLLCAALRAGVAPQLPAVPVQYADYAGWQQEWHSKERLADELDYWRTTLDGLVPLELPADHPRPAKRDPHGDVVTFDIPQHLMAAVTDLGQSREATPFMTLLTAFGTVLARLSGQWDVVVGTPVAGRTRPEVDRTVGFFLNSLVLRCQLAEGLTFTEALEKVRVVCREAFAHQNLSFEHIVDELRPERDQSRTPLYQVAFNLHDGQLIGGMPDRADIDYLHPARQVAKTDLTLYVRSEADGTWSGAFEYTDALFERATVERLADHFLRLLESVTTEPGVTLADAEIMAEQAREQLTGWGTGERADWPAATTLDLFEEQVRATPDAVAVIAGDTRLTYAEVDERANRIAHHLIALGAGPDTVVGLCLARGPELVPALLGTWKADAAYLPLDPSLPAERLRHVLSDCRSPLLVTASDQVSATEGYQGTRVLLDTDRAAIQAHPAERPARSGDPELLAYAIYTSGSTGRPKGVMVHHRGLANHLRWAARDLVGGEGGAPLFSSIAFDLPATNLYVPLITGRAVHVLPADLDLATLGDTLLAGAPYAFVKLTPGHLELLTDQLSDGQMSALARLVLVAGEELPARLANRWLTALGTGRLINEYGPTEASIGSTVHPVDRPQEAAVPLGGPLPNTTTVVLDPAGRPVPIGVAGELHVGGEGLARGYHGRPELTAEKFVPNPYGPAGSRLYRTGDLTRLLPDGSISFLGRIDTQVKLRGYRIELGEIEAVLSELAPVRDAVVIVREGATGEKALVGYLVAEDTGPLDLELVRAGIAERLPDYMVPSAFAVIDRIPLTANGKVDRRALPDLDAGDADYQPPTTPTEERIAQIWAELLGLPRVGVQDNFFALGGHSILAIRMTSQLQDEFDIDLSIGTVFAQPTVGRLAAAIEDQIRAEIEQLSDSEIAESDLFAPSTATAGAAATNSKEN